MSSEVFVHKIDEVKSLLVGGSPYVGRRCREGGGGSFFDGSEDNDFSQIPFPAPLSPSRASGRNVRGSPQPSRSMSSVSGQFSKVCGAKNLLEHVSGYLDEYDTNARRKAMILHQDLEEHYMEPLSRRLASTVSGEGYRKFVRSKSRAITAFEKQTKANDTFLEQLPTIPRLSYDASDLTDPIVKYRKNAGSEKRLARIINKSAGSYVPPKKLSQRDTMNMKKWTVLAETRFYLGKVDQPLMKGKKIMPQKYRSEIKDEFNFFAPPLEQKKVQLHPNRLRCEKDHVMLG